MMSRGPSGLVRCVERRWDYNKMSKISDIVERQVSLEFSVGDLMLIQKALSEFRCINIPDELLDDVMEQRSKVLNSLETVLDREFPLQ